MPEQVHWIHHAPGTVQAGGDILRAQFRTEPDEIVFVAKLDEPVQRFQSEAFLNYNHVSQLMEARIGPGARIRPGYLYIPLVDPTGTLVGTITGTPSSGVAETSISGTLAVEST